MRTVAIGRTECWRTADEKRESNLTGDDMSRDSSVRNTVMRPFV